MSEERPEVAKGTTVCPECGGKLVPILYGLPDYEASLAAQRGEIALGGCLVMGDDPELACTGCESKYWIHGSRRRKPPSK